MKATFRSLRNRNYRLYAAGSAVSNVGTWLQRVAQDWLVLQLTDNSGTALGVTTALQFLPFLLIAPFGGLIADRFPKRRVLQCTQVAMGLTAAALAVLDLSGVVQAWHVYLLAFLFGVAGAIDNPARQSFVVEMVGKEDLSNAVGLNSASFNGARVIGPAVAGLLIVLVGTGWVILLNALTYGATIWALSRMRTSELQTPTPVPRKPGMLWDALLYVRARPDLVLVLTVVFFVGCFGLNFQMTSALMATQVFGKGAGEYGVLGSIMAVGAVTGALVAAGRGTTRLRIVVVAAVGFGVLEIVSGVMPTYVTFALSLPLLGFVQLTMITAANAIMQLTVSAEMRGRVIALYGMVFIGSTPLGAPIVGWVGEAFGARWMLIGGGAVSMLGALVAALVVLRRDGLVVRAHLRPRPHVHVWRMSEYVGEQHATVTVGPDGRTTEPAPVLQSAAVGAGSGPTADHAPAGNALAENALADDALADEALAEKALAGEALAEKALAGDDGRPDDARVPALPSRRESPELLPVGDTMSVRGTMPGRGEHRVRDEPPVREDRPVRADVPVAIRDEPGAIRDEKVAPCSSHPPVPRCATPTPRDSARWRAKGATRLSRRAQAGRSPRS